MNKINNIHNKTIEIKFEEMPYNNKNVLLNEEDLYTFFINNGLNDIKINNINLYRNAFIHKSYCNMKNTDFNTGNNKCPQDCLPLQDMSYERLEYLGDAILNVVVASYLYERYQEQSEGFLSKLRTKIVNGKMLGFLSDKIGFSKFIIISKQVEDVNGRNNYKIMEDIFEAFIGAIYLDFKKDLDINNKNIKFTDLGYHIAELWIINIMEKYLDFSELIKSKTNYKDMLVSYMQHNLQDKPNFYEMNIITKDNNKIFTYCIKDKNNLIISSSTGLTKKDAENNTALEALKYYNYTF